MRIEGAGRMLTIATLCAVSLRAQEPTRPNPAGAPPASTVEEVLVVTASRSEQRLAEAPAALTVLDASDIESLPADDYGDLLRNVPGLNVAQTSARDFNMTARGATSTLAASQLVLLDGRSIYLDFFGFVMWDFLPVNPAEIRQIETVRGPGSAVWGANAMNGVIHLITKRPQEMVGTTLRAGAGERGTLFGDVTHAGVAGDLGYRLALGYFEQDPYDRPTGVIPGSEPPVVYPAYDNTATRQPRADLRFDWELGDGASRLVAAAGYAGTGGIIHSGTGPYDVVDGSSLSYGKLDWTRSALHLGVFANFLDAEATNQLTLDARGEPLGSRFVSETWNLEVSNVSVLAESHFLTYGANLRQSDFEIDIAPLGRERNEWGLFLQDEILLGDRVRWLVGGRWDEIDPLDDGVFSPRTSLLVSPDPAHTFRLSYNEAFISPPILVSYLDQEILQQVGPLLLPAHVGGNPELEEVRLEAWEIGWVGSFARGLELSAAAYRNETEGFIDFFPSRFYGPGNLPAPGPFLPAELVPCFLFAPGTGPQACPLGGLGGFIPSDYFHRNIGRTIDRGVELALEQRLRNGWSWYLNTSWQDEPDFDGVDPAEQNLPPEIRANAGVSLDTGRWFGSVTANHQGSAYWSDVLFARGTTEAFTQLNATAGVRLLAERLSLQVTAANLTDERVQQHIFGDLISRKVTGQVGLRF